MVIPELPAHVTPNAPAPLASSTSVVVVSFPPIVVGIFNAVTFKIVLSNLRSTVALSKASATTGTVTLKVNVPPWLSFPSSGIVVTKVALSAAKATVTHILSSKATVNSHEITILSFFICSSYI